MHTIILGAGIGGLTAGFSLSQLPGETYSVYEKDSSPGGLCRTIHAEDFTFDSVSHVLHFRSREAKDLVHELLAGNLVQQERSACIYFRRRYVPYPFQTHLGFLPILEGTQCLTGFWRAWMGRQINGLRKPQNFGEWIQQQFGDGIARYFMTPYNSKLWGVSPGEMSTDWVRPFVPRTLPADVMASLLSKRTRNAGYNSHLYYPSSGGIQSLIDSLAARVPHLHMNHRVTKIRLREKTVRFDNGVEARYDRLISTTPLKSFVQRAVGMPDELRNEAQKLRSTSLLNITFCIRRPSRGRYHWIYFPESEYPFFRLVFPSNVCPSLAPPGCSIISAEISNPQPGQEEMLTQQSRNLLLRLGLIREASDIAFTAPSFFEHAYPVHDLQRETVVSKLLEFLKGQDVWSVGRFGAWRYSSIDDTIGEALYAIQEMTGPTPVPVSC